jgi:hypothetical protein
MYVLVLHRWVVLAQTIGTIQRSKAPSMICVSSTLHKALLYLSSTVHELCSSPKQRLISYGWHHECVRGSRVLTLIDRTFHNRVLRQSLVPASHS